MPESDTVRRVLGRLALAAVGVLVFVVADRIGLLVDAPGRGAVVPLVATVIVSSWLVLAVVGVVALARRIRSDD